MMLTLLAWLTVATPPVGSQALEPLKVVANLDLARYVGDWFEIARLPNRFQNKCAGDVTATYTARPGGLVVTNKCRERNGKITEASGVARRVDGKPPSMLEVRFAPAFLGFLPQVWGDYQVIALDDAHTYAVVGSPDRRYLWVLSRTPVMDGATYDRLLGIASSQGFDVSKLVKTPQSAR
jgi:apolipoprotein D and lipocalin family protein